MEELPAANPPVRLVKSAWIHFAPRQQTGCIAILSRGLGTRGNFTFQVEGDALRRLETGNVSLSTPAACTLHRFGDMVAARGLSALLAHGSCYSRHFRAEAFFCEKTIYILPFPRIAFLGVKNHGFENDVHR
jgi:hypothetical protein